MHPVFYLFHLFRSFLPLHNPIGFGAADFIGFGLALVLVALTLTRRALSDHARRFAARTGWCLLALFLLPVVLRLAMIGVHPIPTPLGMDDFSFILLGDTLTHFRFSNPAHPMHQFFETLFVLQQPRYASIYPLGQGIALAIGQICFGNPWAGVALSTGAFCAACYWMLRGWTTPGWALLGGVFAALQFGALSQWMNSFWGGAMPALAGCLVCGALPRLEESGRRRYSAVLGAGIGIHAVSRPYETLFVVLSVLLYFAPKFPKLLRAAPMILLALLPALGLDLLQNRSVSGSWTTLPYMLSRSEYGVPSTFTWQPDPIAHDIQTPQQQLVYDGQKSAHDNQAALGFVARLASRVKFYRFFFLAPLYLALPALLLRLREYRYFWILMTILVFALGTNLYPYFFSHYVAAIACLFVLVIVSSLEKIGSETASMLLFVCAAHFVFWYGLHFAGHQDFAHDMWQFETEDVITAGDPQGRNAVRDRLTSAPGKQLVFVRYGPNHVYQEWVYNSADIDASPIVWARDLGGDENEKLRRYYPDRTAWLLQPDVHPPLLTPFFQLPPSPAMETIVPEPTQSDPKRPRPRPHFEDIPDK